MDQRIIERGPRLPVGAAAASLLGVWLGLSAACVVAQDDRGAPSAAYFATFRTFYDGDYKDALKQYESHARRAIKTSQARWIDSICYETMVGECYFEMGMLPQALEHYTAALRLYATYSEWMIRVQFSPTIRPAANVRPAPWGVSGRTSKPGVYPATMLMAMGEINVNDQIKRGGPVQSPQLHPVNVQEIVRCTTLAMRRRNRLLGPTSAYDPLSQELATLLSRKPGPPNHWSEAWINVELGLALVGAGKEAQAVNALKQSLLAGGEFDHPMTCVALLELGRLSMGSGDYTSAAKFFEEASYSAYQYEDLRVLEEAFRYGTVAHMLLNRGGIYPPLPLAAQWAKTKNLRELRASVLLCAAESFAFLGQTAQAREMLAEAQQALANRDMARGRLGARERHLASLVFFQLGKIGDGDTALAAALEYMQHGSLWLFHIGLADTLCLSNAATPRMAMEMFADVLRDPQPGDWQADPLESLSVLTAPHPGPYEHWFEIALDRKEFETAIEIADRTRRHRFFTALPFGGRLHSLRWVLEGPVELLDKASLLQRQELLNRYPAYAQLSQQARTLRESLAKLPLAPPDADMAKQQSAGLQQLTALSVGQEAAMREMAVRREPATLSFPPLRKTQEVQKGLRDGQALLIFFATGRQTYAFLLNRDKYGYWPISAPATLSKQMQGLLREWGMYSANNEISVKDMAENKWKNSAAGILDSLLKGSRADFSQPFDELVIVPDGLLWYLPFEALQVKADGSLRPLLSRVRIRYVPTVGLATLPMPGPPALCSTAVVTGKLFPRDEADVSQKAFEQMSRALPGAVQIRAPLPAPASVYATLFSRLIVLDDMPWGTAGALEFAPLSLDRGRPGSSLLDWMALPWGGPAEVLLPGFHTPAEDAMKNVSRAAPGHEMFLATCGMMSSGARTVLISRWRTGGQTSQMLMREFAQELPHSPAPQAWQRAVLLLAGTRLDLAAEPRLKIVSVDEPPKANHPFFWAGYMLVDAGPKPAPPKDQDNPELFKIRPVGEADKPDAPRKRP